MAVLFWYFSKSVFFSFHFPLYVYDFFSGDIFEFLYAIQVVQVTQDKNTNINEVAVYFYIYELN